MPQSVLTAATPQPAPAPHGSASPAAGSLRGWAAGLALHHPAAALGLLPETWEGLADPGNQCKIPDDNWNWTGKSAGFQPAASAVGRVWPVPAVARCPLPHPDVQVGELLLTCVCAPSPAAGKAAWLVPPALEELPWPWAAAGAETWPAHARPSLTSVNVLSHHAEIVLPEATGGESWRAEPQAAGAQRADVTCTRTSHA